MRIESTPEGLFEEIREGFVRGVENSVERARRGLGGGQLSRTIHSESLGPLSAQVGSDEPGVRAQELGAFVRPRRRHALRFRDGSFSMTARIPAKHFLQRAEEAWAADMTDGLREVSE